MSAEPHSALRPDPSAPEAALRQAFETWLKKLVLPRFGLSEREISTLTLEEIDTMLAEGIDRWNRDTREQGRQEGEARLVLRLLRLKFGSVDPESEHRSAQRMRIASWSGASAS